MSPNALKIHLKSVLFHKCCRNLCVSMPRCIHDTFSHFWRIPSLIYVNYTDLDLSYLMHNNESGLALNGWVEGHVGKCHLKGRLKVDQIVH
jgi:hypothetical protein